MPAPVQINSAARRSWTVDPADHGGTGQGGVRWHKGHCSTSMPVAHHTLLDIGIGLFVTHERGVWRLSRLGQGALAAEAQQRTPARHIENDGTDEQQCDDGACFHTSDPIT